MKIMCCWNRNMRQGQSYETLNIAPALVRLGHKVKIFDLEPFVRQGRPSDIELLDVVKDTNPDLLIYLLYRDSITTSAINYVSHETNTTTLLIAGDDEKFFDLSKQFSMVSNNVVTMCQSFIGKHDCANVLHHGYSANDKVYRKFKIKKNTDISFYGSMANNRINFLNNIVMKDIKIKVYGNGWRDDSCITLLECVRLINESKINLGISEDIVDGKVILQIKARDFEVPMCGGFLLTHANPLLSEYYKVGKEIEVYDDVEDLIKKIKFYLKHDSARERIALAGYKRAHKDHTSYKCWKSILNGLDYKGGSSGTK